MPSSDVRKIRSLLMSVLTYGMFFEGEREPGKNDTRKEYCIPYQR